MAISHVNTTTDTAANGTSVTATKPSGTASGDVLFAVFTSNSQDCTPPSGFTEISDETIEVFRQQVFYKVAGGSEPADYTFSVGAAAPLVVSVSALRGADTSGSPIDITLVAETDTTHGEPYATPGVSGGTAGRLFYGRSSRVSGSTPTTFSASETELADAGVFSGGSVSYSGSLYMDDGEYFTGGAKSGLGITSSESESHNIVFTVGLKSEGASGAMEVQLPSLPTVSMDGSVAYPAELEAELLKPTMSIDVFHGSFDGPLDVQVPISVSIAGDSDLVSTLDVEVPIEFESLGETRRFADNVVVVEDEARWVIILQNDVIAAAANDRRTKVGYATLSATLPLYTMTGHIKQSNEGEAPSVSVSAVANDPVAVSGQEIAPQGTDSVAATVSLPGLVIGSAPALVSVSASVADPVIHQENFPLSASTSVAANDATVLVGRLASAETIQAASVTGDSDVSITSSAGNASVVTTSYDAGGVRVDAETVLVVVTANDSTVNVGPSAEHIDVVAHQ